MMTIPPTQSPTPVLSLLSLVLLTGCGVLEPPPRIIDGNTRVSCTVDCGGDDTCEEATVYVSACDATRSDVCYALDPVTGGDDGNTWFVGLSREGEQSVITDVECANANERREGLPVELVFVLDTTSSMGSAIDGVLASVDRFVNTLAESGLDLRIGGIAFGDEAPLATCRGDDAPYVGLTSRFGEGTAEDPESFNHWLGNLSASHCGDGGGDGPENALDAIEFTLGRDPVPDDAFPAEVFAWSPNALRVLVVITDAPQHQGDQDGPVAHVDLEQVRARVAGDVVVHVVGPPLGCEGTRYEGACACDERRGTCDEGCACDPRCPIAQCAADVTAGLCDEGGALCDIDCPGSPSGAMCDTRVGVCDPDEMDPSRPCAGDVDCASGVPVGARARARRCEPRRLGAGSANVAELTTATGGSFTVLPDDGRVDLTELPLTGVLRATERCEPRIPENAEQLRCVFIEGDRRGEVVVDLAGR
jgi:hypothetical protein